MSHRDNQEQAKQSASRLSLADRTEFPSHDSIEGMMVGVAQRAVEGTLQRLGIDTSDPLSAQQDFARLRALRKLTEDEDFLADLAFMRRWRITSEKITDTGIKAVVRWLVVGALGIVVLLTRDWWISHIKG